MNIRAAQRGDGNAILALMRDEPLAAHWTAMQLAPYLETGDSAKPVRHKPGVVEHFCFCAIAEDSAITGFIAGYRLGHSGGPAEAELENIVVATTQRGRGTGRKLAEALLAWCAAARPCAIRLEVRSTNSAALGLYAALGFVQSGARSDYYRDPPGDAIVMTLKA